MRGSTILPKAGGFYRLAPELGILEAMAVLILVGKALFIYRKSMRQSVLAAMTLRYFKAEDDLWWQRDGPLPASDCYEQTRPIFEAFRD